eukprot:TRINITY_DN3353_c0_g1_i6.p1 TRINITY_DN3353_c0_g1~~TRINITY_DN3353_c0_g1_i6.p1  ORF type:complete len:670 (+),score=154.80 TRINITY_DN3353_c0_g1_i6:129-2138(+)
MVNSGSEDKVLKSEPSGQSQRDCMWAHSSNYKLKSLLTLGSISLLLVLCITSYRKNVRTVENPQAATWNSGGEFRRSLMGGRTNGISSDTVAARTLVVYSYIEGDVVAADNFRFFLRFGVPPDDDFVHFVLVLHGRTNVPPPNYRNVMVLRRAIGCGSYGAYGAVIDAIGWKFLMSTYRFFVFLSSQARGPFLPLYAPATFMWTDAFTSMITEDVKLTGVTAVCKESSLRFREPSVRIQSFLFATDRIGLRILRDSGVFVCTAESNAEEVAEADTSLSVLRAGYNFDVLQMKYKDWDWRQQMTFSDPCEHVAGNGDLFSPNSERPYDGQILHPLELLFYKVTEGNVRNIVNTFTAFALVENVASFWKNRLLHRPLCKEEASSSRSCMADILRRRLADLEVNASEMATVMEKMSHVQSAQELTLVMEKQQEEQQQQNEAQEKDPWKLPSYPDFTTKSWYHPIGEGKEIRVGVLCWAGSDQEEPQSSLRSGTAKMLQNALQQKNISTRVLTDWGAISGSLTSSGWAFFDVAFVLLSPTDLSRLGPASATATRMIVLVAPGEEQGICELSPSILKSAYRFVFSSLKSLCTCGNVLVREIAVVIPNPAEGTQFSSVLSLQDTELLYTALVKGVFLPRKFPRLDDMNSFLYALVQRENQQDKYQDRCTNVSDNW